MITNYLKNIINKKSINYKLFLNRLQKINISESIAESIFDIKQDSKNNYFFYIINQELFDFYFSKFFIEEKDLKLKAAIQGNSKTHKNKYSLLTIKENIDDINSTTLIFTNTEYQIPENFILKNKVIIIENQLNFCRCEDFLNNEDLILADYNIIYGAGKAITNDYFKNFLNSYQEIICCFDIDLAGLDFINIMKNNGINNLIFFFSERQKNIGHKFNKVISTNDFKKILNFEYNNELINEAYWFIRDNKFYIEQEVFLIGDNNE